MSIQGKLILGFGLIVLFISTQSLITYYYVTSSEKMVKKALVDEFTNMTTIAKMAVLAQQLRRYEKEYFIYASNPEKRKKYEIEWSDAHKKLQNILTSVRSNNTGAWSQSDKLEFDKWQTSLEDYHRGFTLVTENVDRGLVKGTLEANNLIQNAKNRFKVFLKGTSVYGTAKLEESKAVEAKINSNFLLVNRIVLIASGAGIFLSVLLMIIIPGAISRPIQILTNAANTMSTGQLDQPIPLTSGSEFKVLADTLERMRISQKTLLDRYRANRS